MSSPISGGGSPIQPIHTNPVLKGGKGAEEPSAKQLAQHIEKYLNRTPPDYDGMFNYIVKNAQAMQDAGVSSNDLSAALQDIAQHNADPEDASIAANGLVALLTKK